MPFRKKVASEVQNSNQKLVKYLETFENTLLSQSCLLLNAAKFWDQIKNLRQRFVDKFKSKKTKKKE